ncbi:hypothetical protein CNMCM5623_007849 [Aspergillus felis]|uniref:Myb-like domain-containing protein n=1 Tax=Aspergillus felis TaxID=1287682 RepID=A0A8H6PYN7_9EURO|nr:hypothetical protein CNMCM5623_007849 [Aspergillus felis]
MIHPSTTSYGLPLFSSFIIHSPLSLISLISSYQNNPPLLTWEDRKPDSNVLSLVIFSSFSHFLASAAVQRSLFQSVPRALDYSYNISRYQSSLKAKSTDINMSTLKKELNRPKKRTLVRWDSDLDELLLLTVQSVCNAKNVKIPWADVASTMGHNVTEGAIVQHLSKLRSRRVDADKPVPPPLRRGGIGAPNKSSKASAAYLRGGTRRRMRNARESDSAADPSDLAQYTDISSDEEYVVRRHSKAQRDAAHRKSSRVQSKEDHQVQPQSASDQDADGSPIGSEDLVVSGAQFLEYPNHRQSQNRSPSRLRKRSKVVVLRYRRGAQPEGEKPVKVESPEHTTVSSFDPHNQSLLDQQLYQDLHGTDKSNAMGAADTHSMSGNYLSAGRSNMVIPSIPNPNSNFLDFASSQGLHMNAYQNFYPSSQNEQLGFVPNNLNDLNTHQSEQMGIAPGEQNMYFDDLFQYIHANDGHKDNNGANFAGPGAMDPFF